MPTLTPPAPDNDKLASVCVLELLPPVVLPRAAMLLTDPLVNGAEIISTPLPAAVVEKPAVAPSIAEMVSAVRVRTLDEVAPPVLPITTMFSAVPLAAGADPDTIKTLFELYPTLMSPAPLTVTLRASKVVEEDDPVVLPVAKPPMVWTL